MEFMGPACLVESTSKSMAQKNRHECSANGTRVRKAMGLNLSTHLEEHQAVGTTMKPNQRFARRGPRGSVDSKCSVRHYSAVVSEHMPLAPLPLLNPTWTALGGSNFPRSLIATHATA